MPSISFSRALHLGGLNAQRIILADIRHRTAEVGAEIEHVVLDASQHAVRKRVGLQPCETNRRICLVHRAIGCDAEVVLRDARAVAKRGFAAVSALGVDLRELDHGSVPFQVQKFL